MFNFLSNAFHTNFLGCHKRYFSKTFAQ